MVVVSISELEGSILYFVFENTLVVNSKNPAQTQ